MCFADKAACDAEMVKWNAQQKSLVDGGDKKFTFTGTCGATVLGATIASFAAIISTM